MPLLLPYYHMVTDHDVPHVKHLYHFRSISEFEADIDFMLRHFSPVSLADVIANIRRELPLSGWPLFLSFDDGFRELHDVVAPILRAKGMPATFFLTTGFLDNKDCSHSQKSSLLIEHLTGATSLKVISMVHATLDQAGIGQGELAARLLAVNYHQRSVLDRIAVLSGYDFTAYLKTVQPYLTSDQVRALLQDGFTIGAHSVDHPQYDSLPLGEQLKQTRSSIDELKHRFSLDYAAFAFPHSDIGVTRAFFDAIRSNGDLDASFGTRGFIADELPFHRQRFTMERTSHPARRTIARQCARRLLRQFSGRGVVRRPREISNGSS